MRDKRILYVALGALLVVGIGAAAKNNANKKCDCPGENAVQGQVTLSSVGGFEFCSSIATVYTVPAGKRLVVEWISVETSIFGGMAASHPAEVDIISHDGSGDIFYPLVRLEDPIIIGDSFFLGSRWQGPVRIYTEPGQELRARMCFESQFEFVEQVGTVGFSGFLVDV